MIRDAAVAGQFYPGTASSLLRLIERLTEKGRKKKNAMGIVSPHAGFVYSGPVAGAVFSSIAHKDTYIILGPNHTGSGRPFSIMSSGKWRTPLGEVPIDEELACEILKRSRFIQDDPRAHAFEHSVEVQLPFLQYFNKDFKFVPIVLSHGDIDSYRDIGLAIADSIKQLKRDALVVASSDFTHYEPHKIAEAKDAEAIRQILDLNEEGLLEKIDELDISMCGYAPVVCMLVAVKSQGAKKAELVKYQTSGDTSGDYSAVVGYGGIIVS